MINYSCDLCGKECNSREFVLPISATWVDGEPCDLMPIKMNLCKECKSEIYKVIEKLTAEERIKTLNRQALDIKMNR